LGARGLAFFKNEENVGLVRRLLDDRFTSNYDLGAPIKPRVDGSAGFDTLPGLTPEQDQKYYAMTVRPTVFINLVPDHIIFHRMYPMAADRTVVECDWLYAPDVVAEGRDVEHSVELFHRVNL